MTGLVVPVSRNGEQANRLIEGIIDLPQITTDTKITLVNVFEEFDADSYDQLMAEDVGIDPATLYEEDDIPEMVVSAAETLSDAGFTVDIRRKHGKVTECILELAQEIDADAIAIAGRQRSPVGKVLLGSVTQGVLLSADRPVIVIPKGEDYE